MRARGTTWLITGMTCGGKSGLKVGEVYESPVGVGGAGGRGGYRDDHT